MAEETAKGRAYDALAAEYARLTAAMREALDEIERLRHEVKQLRSEVASSTSAAPPLSTRQR